MSASSVVRNILLRNHFTPRVGAHEGDKECGMNLSSLEKNFASSGRD